MYGKVKIYTKNDIHFADIKILKNYYLEGKYIHSTWDEPCEYPVLLFEYGICEITEYMDDIIKLEIDELKFVNIEYFKELDFEILKMDKDKGEYIIKFWNG